MLESFRSEWIKLRRRAMLVGAVLMPLATLIFVPLGISSAVRGGGRGGMGPQALTVAVLAGDKGLTTLLSRGGTLVAVIALAIVAAAVAVEYSHGTLRNLLVRQPHRLELLAGKFLALLSFVYLAATVALVVGVIAAFVTASSRGIDTSAWTSTTGITNLAGMYGDVLLAIFAYAAAGFFSAILFRAAAPAIAVPLAYIIIVENLIGGVWSSAPDWLFGKLISSVLNGESVIKSDTLLTSYDRGLLLGMAWVALFAILTGFLFRTRDVTS